MLLVEQVTFSLLNVRSEIVIIAVHTWHNIKQVHYSRLFQEDQFLEFPDYCTRGQSLHVRPGYRQKSADLQGTLKVHL